MTVSALVRTLRFSWGSIWFLSFGSLTSLALLSGAAQAKSDAFASAQRFASSPSTPQVSQASPVEPLSSPATERLSGMFSTEIQSIIGACADQGKVDLAATTRDAPIVCGDGSIESTITYDKYVNTVADLLAASGLVGFRTVTDVDPRVTPAMLTAFLSSPEGIETLRSAVDTAITRSQLLPINGGESTALLSNEVVNRLKDSLQSPSNLENLLGTQEQYAQVVDNFCTAPGMSIEQAQQMIPGLTSIQLFAICVQEAGVADEVLQFVQ